MNRSTDQSGAALILSLFFAIIVTGIVATGSIYLRSHRATSETKFRVYSQATQFARSGLTEALSWFRRQPTQPVLDFEPAVDLTANPPIDDTLDAEIGIAREFRISGATWGRYEVWKEWAGDPDPDRAAWRAQIEASDVSTQRGLGTPGSSWRIRSVGYLYHLEDPAVPFDQAPNRVLASRMLETEILRLKITPPGQAALSVASGSGTQVNNLGRVEGGATGAGVFYPQGTGTPATGPWWQFRVTGSPALSVSASYDDSYASVFGITFEELRGMADTFVTDTDDFPAPVQTHAVVVADCGPITFDSTRPLRGSGLVVIKGDVTVAPGSASLFTGFLYVDGNLTLNAPVTIAGAVVVTGSFTAQGIGDYARITFDDDALTALRIEVGQYRLAGAIRPIHNRE